MKHSHTLIYQEKRRGDGSKVVLQQYLLQYLFLQALIPCHGAHNILFSSCN